MLNESSSDEDKGSDDEEDEEAGEDSWDEFLRKDENKWMKTVINIVRDSSLYFSPKIRTKIINEGWASYWHDKLFMLDDRIKGNEIKNKPRN